MSHNTTKICNVCKQSFPAINEYWYRYTGSPDGLSYTCKECNRIRSRARAASHRQEALERATKWNRENKEHKKTYDKKRTKKLEVVARRKKRAKERAPELRAQRKAWNEANPEKAAKTKRVSVRNRRARLANAEGTHNARDIERLYTEQEGRCLYCGITLFDDYHVDHITPVSRGGANSVSNLAITCSDCNQSKSDKTVEEWQTVRGW